MKRQALLTFVCLCLVCLCEGLQAQTSEFLHKPFVHPGMSQSLPDLERMHQLIENDAEPWATAYANLQRAADLQFQPSPVPEISVGPYGANSIGGKEFEESGKAAHCHALMWTITRDRRYARKAIEILNAWSRVLRGFDANNAKLNVGLFGYDYLNAAELLKHTDSGWQPEDIRRFTQMVLCVFYPTIQDFFTEANGNWDASMISTMMCIGVFTDRPDIFNRALERFYRGEGNSGITKYLYPSGQCQETTRDWDHVQLGLGELAKAAQTAWTQGIDLYAVAGNRLAQGFEYACRYLATDSIELYGTPTDRERNSFKKDVYESIYQHYKDEKGIRLPYTERILTERTRPTSSLGVLTATRVSSTTSGRPLSDFVPATGYLRPAITGATPDTVHNLPEDAVWVRPGESIQAAIDTNRGKHDGKWIVLEAGVHTLDEPLRLYSGTRITGMGRATVIFPAPGVSTAIVNGEACLHHVVICNLLMEGATKVTEGTDPNDDRRRRAYMHAPSREGIVLKSDRSEGIRDLVLTNVTVQNFTKSGVNITGGKDLVIARCDFSDNGSSVVPGPGFHHNLHLSYIDSCRIHQSRFDTSPYGNGIDLTFCRNVRVEQCEAARNRRSGIRCAESRHISLTDNLVEGNDRHGIFLERQFEGCSDITLRGNTAQNNTLRGIEAASVSILTIDNNYCLHNGYDNR